MTSKKSAPKSDSNSEWVFKDSSLTEEFRIIEGSIELRSGQAAKIIKPNA